MYFQSSQDPRVYNLPALLFEDLSYKTRDAVANDSIYYGVLRVIVIDMKFSKVPGTNV